MGSSPLRLVFTHASPDHQLALAPLFPAAAFKPGKHMPLGGALYVVHREEHLADLEPWFPGVGVRVRARLAREPLSPGSAVYLPVSYESWAAVIPDAGGFGAAMEAARVLKGVRTVVCPAFECGADAQTAYVYRRWQDRIVAQIGDLNIPGAGGKE